MPNLGLTFLAPAAGLIAAGIALPALAVLYFLKLRRRPLRVSSTLLWSQATADLQVNAPFRMIRFSWLLVLQALVLACFLAALARPALDAGAQPGGTVLLVLDRSASMNALDGAASDDPASTSRERSRLDVAKTRAIELIDRLGSEAQAALIVFGARAEARTSLTRDRALLRAAVRAVTPTDEPGDPKAALALVAAMAARPEGEGDEAAAPRVFFLSDGGDMTETGEAPAIAGGDIVFNRVGPAPEAPRDNLGIVSLAAKRDFQDPATVRAFARVLNTSDTPITTALAWRLDDASIASTPLTVPARGTDGTPGEATRTVDAQVGTSAVLSVSIARRDLLEVDNGAAVVLRSPAPPKMVVVQPNTTSGVADELVLDALSALGAGDVKPLSLGAYEALGAERVRELDLVVFDRALPSALPPVASLSLGATVPIPGLGLRVPDPGDPDGAPTLFAFWQRSHPVMRYVSLGAVAVARPLRLTLPDPQGAMAGASVVSSTVLASGRSGPLIALIEHAGLRRLVVAFELADSRWWQDPSFPLFMKNAVDYLTLGGDESAGQSTLTGQAASVRPAPGTTTVRVSGPETFERAVPSTGGDRLSIGPISRAGVYQAQGVVDADRWVAASLLDPGETSLRTAEAIRAGGQRAVARSVAQTAPREIWDWFVLAGLGLAAIEWLVYARKMRI